MKIIKFEDTILEEQGSGDLPSPCICGSKKKVKKRAKKMKIKNTPGVLMEKCGVCGGMKKKKSKKEKKMKWSSDLMVEKKRKML